MQQVKKSNVIRSNTTACPLPQEKCDASDQRACEAGYGYWAVVHSYGADDPFQIGGQEVIALEGHLLDPQVCTTLHHADAVENREQLLTAAPAVIDAGAQLLRGGAFTARTSPYQFQGLGMVGLRLLTEAREESGLPVVTEVMEPGMVETVSRSADVLQIGSHNSSNVPLLRTVGQKSNARSVLLKRGLAASIEEWRRSAEYIVAAGNPQVIFRERGVRNFDPETRTLLNLACTPLLHGLMHRPKRVGAHHVPPSPQGTSADPERVLLQKFETSIQACRAYASSQREGPISTRMRDKILQPLSGFCGRKEKGYADRYS